MATTLEEAVSYATEFLSHTDPHVRAARIVFLRGVLEDFGVEKVTHLPPARLTRFMKRMEAFFEPVPTTREAAIERAKRFAETVANRQNEAAIKRAPTNMT